MDVNTFREHGTEKLIKDKACDSLYVANNFWEIRRSGRGCNNSEDNIQARGGGWERVVAFNRREVGG